MRLVVCLTMYLMPILANAAQTKDRRRSKTAAARGCQGVAQHGRPRHLTLRRAVLPERRTGAASETGNCALICSMQARRRVGLRSFPWRPRSGLSRVRSETALPAVSSSSSFSRFTCSILTRQTPAASDFPQARCAVGFRNHRTVRTDAQDLPWVSLMTIAGRAVQFL